MNIIVTGKQLDLTSGLKNLVHEEFSFLEGFLPEDKVVTVTLESKPQHQAIVWFYYEQELIRLAFKGDDMYRIVPQLAKKLEKKLRSFKQMQRAYRKEALNKEEPIVYNGALEDKPHISKRKRFEMKPMSEEEAILQSQTLGHPHFIFSNTDLNGRISLLYTRKDGDYGIIETSY